LDEDVAWHVGRLRQLEDEGKIAAGYPNMWYAMFEEALIGLQTLAERHPFAPERRLWRRDVRNVLFADYRILYLIVGDLVWAMRVRHQRQRRLKAPGPGTAYRPEITAE
jgi:hypothetical protein